MRGRWFVGVILVAGLTPIAAMAYEALGLLIVTFGVGNESHFQSSAFQLERANRLLKLSGPMSSSSISLATQALLPPGASSPSWSYDTGDDSWLCAVATLHWRIGAEEHRAQWVMRYCADPLWREHFVEAAALDNEAKALTPHLAQRDSIYGDGRVPTWPVGGGRWTCFVE